METQDINKEVEFHLYDADTIDAIIKNKIANVKVSRANAKKWSENELNIRRMVIFDLIRQNLSKRRVKEELKERWGIADRTFEEWYKDAIESIIEDNKDLIRTAREQIIMRLEGVAEASFNNGDMSNSLKAIDQLSKIFGLYTEKKEINVKGDTIKFDFGEKKDE